MTDNSLILLRMKRREEFLKRALNSKNQGDGIGNDAGILNVPCEHGQASAVTIERLSCFASFLMIIDPFSITKETQHDSFETLVLIDGSCRIHTGEIRSYTAPCCIPIPHKQPYLIETGKDSCKLNLISVPAEDKEFETIEQVLQRVRGGKSGE